MGPVNKFFNTGQICTKQVTSLESWILSEGRPAMGISFPLIPLIFSNAGFFVGVVSAFILGWRLGGMWAASVYFLVR